jgi:broad specificity phosphatase PhoE
MTALTVHLVRHGRVASHRGDVPVSPEGYAEIEATAEHLAGSVAPEECIHLLYTATLRSRETADALHRALRATINPEGVEILPPVEEPAIRNPDMFLAGRRVEMVSTGAALAEQIPGTGLDPATIERLPFYGEFLPHRDRIGYWLDHSDPPGEDAATVARRIVAWGLSLQDLPTDRSHRYIAVTHSPILRAVLKRYLLTEDPGEPGWVESVDLDLNSRGAVTVAFRDAQRTTTGR